MGQKRNIISPSCERKKYTFFRKPTTLKKLGHSVLINWNGLLCIACETLPKDETGQQRTNGHWTYLDICDEMKIPLFLPKQVSKIVREYQVNYKFCTQSHLNYAKLIEMHFSLILFEIIRLFGVRSSAPSCSIVGSAINNRYHLSSC